MTLEQSPEGALCVEIQSKGIKVGGTSMCKGLGAETCLAHWRNKEARVSGLLYLFRFSVNYLILLFR